MVKETHIMMYGRELLISKLLPHQPRKKRGKEAFIRSITITQEYGEIKSGQHGKGFENSEGTSEKGWWSQDQMDL